MESYPSRRGSCLAIKALLDDESVPSQVDVDPKMRSIKDTTPLSSPSHLRLKSLAKHLSTENIPSSTNTDTMTDYKFEGWLGLDSDSVNGKMVWGEFEPKPWEETDIDIKVSHCGICGSDLHTLRSGWVRDNCATCCFGSPR